MTKWLDIFAAFGNNDIVLSPDLNDLSESYYWNRT